MSAQEEQAPQPARMVFEEDLRRYAGPREFDLEEQRQWMAFRRNLPVGRWLERSRSQPGSAGELRRRCEELERYRERFAAEAAELGLTLDMERNYYKEAVALAGRMQAGEGGRARRQEQVRQLLVLTDLKDAGLALQILRSIA